MTRALATLTLLLALASPSAAQQKGRKVAFLVGIGQFKQSLTDLRGMPQRDVAKLGELLKENGFEVVTLTDKEATKANVERRFRDLLSGGDDLDKAVGQGDTVLVAVCTHGFTLDVPDPVTNEKRPEPFLAGFDAIPGNPKSMISVAGLLDIGKPFGATKLFLLDACREVPREADRGTRSFDASQVSPPPRTSVLFSCDRGQVAHQSEKTGGHGLFTFVVLDVLRGKTGLAGDVSWLELVVHVDKRFHSPDFVREHIPPGKPQTPSFAQGEAIRVPPLLTIRGAAASAPPAPPPASGPKVRRVALLVGIDKYRRRDDFPGLNFCKNDVTALAGVFKKGGFDEVVTLTDADATRAEIEKTYKGLLDGGGDATRRLRKDDVFVVVLCGHGLSVELPGGERRVPQPVFAPHDGDKKNVTSLVAVNGLLRTAEATGQTTLFLLDAAQETPDRGDRGPINGDRLTLPARAGVLFACEPGQRAFESDKVRHGLFTHAVLQAVRGETGMPGEITWMNLVSSVQQSFESPEFRKLIPGGQRQTPLLVSGQVPRTVLFDRPVK